MKTGRAFFCVIQYARVPGSADTRNVGLLLISSEFHFIQAWMMAGFELPQAVDSLGGPSDVLDSVPEQTRHQKQTARKSFRNLTQLKDFIATLSGGLFLSASSTRKVTDPAAELGSLYDLYVVRQNRPSEDRLQVSPLSCLAS